MEITLRNFNNDRVSVKIPDDTEYIEGEIISGDMVMTYPFLFDSDVLNIRKIFYNDGTFHIDKKDFGILDSDDFDVYTLLESSQL